MINLKFFLLMSIICLIKKKKKTTFFLMANGYHLGIPEILGGGILSGVENITNIFTFDSS